MSYIKEPNNHYSKLPFLTQQTLISEAYQLPRNKKLFLVGPWNKMAISRKPCIEWNPWSSLVVVEKAFPLPLLRMKPLLLRLWQYKEMSMHLLGFNLCLTTVLPMSMVDPLLDSHIGH
jgi:hypothetical protein